MKPSLLLACSTLLSLGCGGELPAPTAPASAAPAQRPAEVTTVDLRPPPPPAAPVTKVVAPAPEVVAKTPEELQAQRQSALKEAADYGMLGLLSTGDPNAPTAPWG